MSQLREVELGQKGHGAPFRRTGPFSGVTEERDAKKLRPILGNFAWCPHEQLNARLKHGEDFLAMTFKKTWDLQVGLF